MLPFLLACLLLNSAFWRYEDKSELLSLDLDHGGRRFLFSGVDDRDRAGAAVSRAMAGEKSKEDRMLSLNAFLFSAVLAGGAGGGLCWEYLKLLSRYSKALIALIGSWPSSAPAVCDADHVDLRRSASWALPAGAVEIWSANGGPGWADT